MTQNEDITFIHYHTLLQKTTMAYPQQDNTVGFKFVQVLELFPTVLGGQSI